MMPTMIELSNLMAEITDCRLCSELPMGPKPILQLNTDARILIAGQAPGRLAHVTGKPFNDPSGDRLRDWLGVDSATFYDTRRFAILPMAFCYPGTSKGGDLAPPAQCAQQWRARVLSCLPNIELTLVIGRHAMNYHLRDFRGQTLTEVVKRWREYWPRFIPMPHPSPRNNRWLKSNPWFERDLVPALRERVSELLQR